MSKNLKRDLAQAMQINPPLVQRSSGLGHKRLMHLAFGERDDMTASEAKAIKTALKIILN